MNKHTYFIYLVLYFIYHHIWENIRLINKSPIWPQKKKKERERENIWLHIVHKKMFLAKHCGYLQLGICALSRITSSQLSIGIYRLWSVYSQNILYKKLTWVYCEVFHVWDYSSLSKTSHALWFCNLKDSHVNLSSRDSDENARILKIM